MKSFEEEVGVWVGGGVFYTLPCGFLGRIDLNEWCRLGIGIASTRVMAQKGTIAWWRLLLSRLLGFVPHKLSLLLVPCLEVVTGVGGGEGRLAEVRCR